MALAACCYYSLARLSLPFTPPTMTPPVHAPVSLYLVGPAAAASSASVLCAGSRRSKQSESRNVSALPASLNPCFLRAVYCISNPARGAFLSVSRLPASPLPLVRLYVFVEGVRFAAGRLAVRTAVASRGGPRRRRAPPATAARCRAAAGATSSAPTRHGGVGGLAGISTVALLHAPLSM